jgi:hypothetical protein
MRFFAYGEGTMPHEGPFTESHPVALVGRALVFARQTVFDPPALPGKGVIFLEAHGPDLETWTIAGRFAFADLLGAYDPEKWAAFLKTAKTAIAEARRLAFQRWKSEP